VSHFARIPARPRQREKSDTERQALPTQAERTVNRTGDTRFHQATTGARVRIFQGYGSGGADSSIGESASEGCETGLRD